MTTLGLKNVNMLSKEQFDGVAEPVQDELWSVEVETYSDDDGNWYRVYPDGWCEQGGTGNAGTFTFLKPFRDNLYNLSLGTRTPTHTYISARSATSMTTTGSTANWEARGYIA